MFTQWMGKYVGQRVNSVTQPGIEALLFQPNASNVTSRAISGRNAMPVLNLKLNIEVSVLNSCRAKLPVLDYHN
jgi:hypothetical protein